MTKHVPLFLPLGSIRLLTIFFSFCIIFVHPALADKMAESPELFDTAFTLQERLDIPDGFVQREKNIVSNRILPRGKKRGTCFVIIGKHLIIK
jgi:hypothetical protein